MHWQGRLMGVINKTQPNFESYSRPASWCHYGWETKFMIPHFTFVTFHSYDLLGQCALPSWLGTCLNASVSTETIKSLHSAAVSHQAQTNGTVSVMQVFCALSWLNVVSLGQKKLLRSALTILLCLHKNNLQLRLNSPDSPYISMQTLDQTIIDTFGLCVEHHQFLSRPYFHLTNPVLWNIS